MYGTWNRLKAVAVARNATSTQITPATGPNTGGTAKVSAKNTGRVKAPMSMKRLRLPVRMRLRSDHAPITGSITTSQIFARVTIVPARIAATPRLSVRKYASTRPGSVANPPVPREPAA